MESPSTQLVFDKVCDAWLEYHLTHLFDEHDVALKLASKENITVNGGKEILTSFVYGEMKDWGD